MSAAGEEESSRLHLQIIMATHNGARFLRQQLDSIAAQDHRDWSLWVSDDRSTEFGLNNLYGIDFAY